MAESKMPARIRVAQDAVGFWTCREAVSGSPEFIRADLVERLAAALREFDCPRPCNGRPDDFSVRQCVGAGECGCGANHALQAYEAGQ